MSSSSYQNVTNLIERFPIRRSQSVLRMLQRGKIVLLTFRFLDVAVFTSLALLSLLIPCKLSLPKTNEREESVSSRCT